MVNHIFSPEQRKEYLTPEITTFLAEIDTFLMSSFQIPDLYEERDPFEWE